MAFPSFDGICLLPFLPSILTPERNPVMQTTFKIFFSCLLCFSLTLLSGCGGSVPALTPAEQAEVDKYITDHGTAAMAYYTATVNRNTDKDRVLKFLRYFISQGADVNAKDGDGDTPLHNILDAEILKFLVSKGADVNAKNVAGETSLRSAASRLRDWERYRWEGSEVMLELLNKKVEYLQ